MSMDILPEDRTNDTDTHYDTRVEPVELDTIIAALRYWQRCTILAHRQHDPIATEHGVPLDDEEIDRLIERLNGGEGPL